VGTNDSFDKLQSSIWTDDGIKSEEANGHHDTNSFTTTSPDKSLIDRKKAFNANIVKRQLPPRKDNPTEKKGNGDGF
jgi:hypothetical protein